MTLFLLGCLCGFVIAIIILFYMQLYEWEVIKMNKEDILLLVDMFDGKEVDTTKIKEKLGLIKKQIEAQDVIHEVQKELQEMDKVKE